MTLGTMGHSRIRRTSLFLGDLAWSSPFSLDLDIQL